MAKKFRVGIIGNTGRGDYGHGLDTVWKGFPQCEIVGVADPHEEGRAKAVERLGAPKDFADYHRLLEETRPDVVAICPRWIDEHCEMCLAAAERGIHIYLEKPFCRTPEEADRIIDACERTHTQLGIAFVTRYSPKLARVQILLEEGAIGDVLEFRARGKEDRRGGAEDLWVLGTHALNIVHTLGGDPKWCFAELLQEGQPVTKADVVEGAEGVGPLAGNGLRAMYGLTGGKTAYFSSFQDKAGDPSRFGVQIYGSKGVLEILSGSMPSVKYLADPSWSPLRGGGNWQEVSSAGIGEPEPLSDPKYAEYNYNGVHDFLTALEEGRSPKADMYQARWTVEMIAAVFDSHRRKAPVEFPLETRVNPLTLL